MSFRPFHENSPLDAPPLSDASAILVVDEDPAFQLGLKTFLREFVGFEKVITARSGQEALDFIRAEPSIEVVTIDAQVGGMSGLEMLSSLREQTQRPVAALMITGAAGETLKPDFHAMGSDLLLTNDFLTKPVQFEKLEPVVLAAHESVRAAKKRLLERSLAPEADGADLSASETASESGIAAMLAAQSRRLDEVQSEVRAQRGKWRADFWKVAFAALLLWLAGQFGLLDGLGERWQGIREGLRQTITRQIEAWQRPGAEPTRDGTAPSESDAPSVPASPPAVEERPGQPL